MKSTIRICTVLLLVAFLLPLTAQADVIYQPFDNFYMQHLDECTYVARRYTAKGPNGSVTIYVSPVDPEVKKTYDNGTVLDVSYSYLAEDNILWACIDNWDDGTTGWLPMEYLELIYDGKSFEEEHSDKFVPVEKELDVSSLGDGTIYFWVYPGSKEYIQGPAGIERGQSFHTGYTDEYGYEWGQCGYFMGIKGHWINLNNPTADYETLYPDVQKGTDPPETEPYSTEQVVEIKPAGNHEKLTVILAVTAVVAITAALLVILKKKQK